MSGHVKWGPRLFLLSFVVLILLGTLLLKIPGMYRPGPLSWLDALFTATSSVCVTGLTTKPISEFGFFGQLVVLLLIQVGGLGIMTLTAAILLALGRGLSFGESLMISRLNDKFSLRGTDSLMRTVVRYTFYAEGVGFLALLPGMWLSKIGIWKGLWGALFMTVSSFCNAGLTPFQESLVGIHRSAQLVCALLAIAGGLGVYVIYDLLQAASWKSQRLREHSNPLLAKIGRLGEYVIKDRLKVVSPESPRLRVHSKLVLLTTGILLIFGTIAIKLLSTETGLGWFDAFCFSVTSRTCGWNTAPMSQLPVSATRFIMLLMLIGGSPGGTAGGIKTSTVALAFMGIISVLRGDSETIVFKRRIPTGIVLRAQAIIILFALLSSLGSTALAEMETDAATRGPQIEKEVQEKADGTTFEAVSALTTTGLSIHNTTSQLKNKSKALLILFMYLGRVGPFAALLFLIGREKHSKLKYPEEQVIIG